MFQSLFGSLLNHLYRYGNENVSVRHLSLICITPILTTTYSLKTCSVFERSCHIYSPKSFGFFRKELRQVNVGEKLNLLSIIVNIGKSRQYCLNENINDSLFIKWDKRERVLSDITKLRVPPSFWIATWVDFGHVLGNVYSRTK